jgi:pimeloyl-ACP methyl ester carboxylesterase
LLVSPAPTAGIGALRGSGSDLSRLLRLFDADDPGQRVALEALLRWGQAFGVYRGSLRRGLQELVGRVPAPQLEVLLDDAALLSPEPILGFLAALQHWRPGLQLGRVTAPVTVLWGEDDPIISREIAAATAGDFPNSKLLIWRGAGHSPQLEQPGPFADLAFGLALNPRLPQDSPG